MKSFVLFECHNTNRHGDPLIADQIIKTSSFDKALKFLGEAARRDRLKDAPSVEYNPNSVCISYTDAVDGQVYQIEYTMIGEFSSEEEAESCKQAHHENWVTLIIR